jgi:uncharacterized protein (DUF1800 family)
MPNLREAAIAANRFGFGARPGELTTISSDPRGWVKSQLGPQPLPPAIEALPAAEDDLLAFGRWTVQRRFRANNGARDENLMRQAARQGVSEQQMQALTTEQDFIQNFRQRVTTAVNARIIAAVASDNPVYERQVHFWGNHFTVSSAKPQAVALPPSFERDAVRANVGGSFVNMLMASSKHPGMLVYLDNWLSIGPHSPAADNPRLRRGFGAQRATGINENLAREIMELHTLGVHGGYTQADVTTFAGVITGWTYRRQTLVDFASTRQGTLNGEQLFEFDGDAHEPGAKTVLGKSYRQNGVSQGEAVLSDLAHHPSTARFIATKLTRHYIADTPPPAAVERVAEAFQRSGGDLKHTMEVIVDSPETWTQPFTKFKQPEEYAISLLRAANIQQLPPNAAIGAMQAMGQRPYSAPGPDGWADISDAWLTADLVWKRLEFAQTFAGRIARSDIDPVQVGEACQGELLSADTRAAIQNADSPAQGLSILFGSPELQRR